MMCCSNCFNDSFLEKLISTEYSRVGICNYCGSEGHELVEPNKLNYSFQELFSLYYETDETEGSSSLVDLLNNDWRLFEKIDDHVAVRLLNEIFEEDISNKLFYPITVRKNKIGIDDWAAFGKELKHENRYFPKSFPDEEYLRNLFDFTLIFSSDHFRNFYRARVCHDNTAHPLDKMGAPPAPIATFGRANPAGIPYLYCATHSETAISEVRPHVSAHVSVVEIDINIPLRLIDLRDPKSYLSPFGFEEESKLQLLHSGMPLLCLFGEELSKPVNPNSAQLEYLTSQFLCEFLKREGFDGVVYNSSLENGSNLALFSTEKISLVRVHQNEVYGLRLQHRAIET